jgi:hypothetical protein
MSAVNDSDDDDNGDDAENPTTIPVRTRGTVRDLAILQQTSSLRVPTPTLALRIPIWPFRACASGKALGDERALRAAYSGMLPNRTGLSKIEEKAARMIFVLNAVTTLMWVLALCAVLKK